MRRVGAIARGARRVVIGNWNSIIFHGFSPGTKVAWGLVRAKNVRFGKASEVIEGKGEILLCQGCDRSGSGHDQLPVTPLTNLREADQAPTRKPRGYASSFRPGMVKKGRHVLVVRCPRQISCGVSVSILQRWIGTVCEQDSHGRFVAALGCPMKSCISTARQSIYLRASTKKQSYHRGVLAVSGGHKRSASVTAKNVRINALAKKGLSAENAKMSRKLDKDILRRGRQTENARCQPLPNAVRNERTDEYYPNGC